MIEREAEIRNIAEAASGKDNSSDLERVLI